MPTHLGNSAVATELEKINFPSSPKKSSDSAQATAHPIKIMLKILQARLQQYVNGELPDVKLALAKAEEPEIKLPTSVGS